MAVEMGDPLVRLFEFVYEYLLSVDERDADAAVQRFNTRLVDCSQMLMNELKTIVPETSSGYFKHSFFKSGYYVNYRPVMDEKDRLLRDINTTIQGVETKLDGIVDKINMPHKADSNIHLFEEFEKKYRQVFNPEIVAPPAQPLHYYNNGNGNYNYSSPLESHDMDPFSVVTRPKKRKLTETSRKSSEPKKKSKPVIDVSKPRPRGRPRLNRDSMSTTTTKRKPKTVRKRKAPVAAPGLRNRPLEVILSSSDSPVEYDEFLEDPFDDTPEVGDEIIEVDKNSLIYKLVEEWEAGLKNSHRIKTLNSDFEYSNLRRFKGEEKVLFDKLKIMKYMRKLTVDIKMSHLAAMKEVERIQMEKNCTSYDLISRYISSRDLLGHEWK